MAILIIGTAISSLSAEKVNGNEYNTLLSQCRAIRDQIISQHSFEPIRQQALRNFHTQTVPAIAERFTAMGGGQRSSAFQNSIGQAGVTNLQSQLDALEVSHNLQVRAAIVNQISLYLQTVGTPAARQLLADLIANKIQL